MTVIVGYGNDLRGEDGFGIEVIKKLQNQNLKDQKEIKLISAFQLTPELTLELQKATKIIFVDATFSNKNQYSLACSLQIQNNTNLSHHISPNMIIEILDKLYDKNPKFQIYSMLTNNFDSILDESKYKQAINNTFKHILDEINLKYTK